MLAWKEEGPGALDWLLRTNLPLMQAVRHHRAGDGTKAMAAFGEWDPSEDIFDVISVEDIYPSINTGDVSDDIFDPLKPLAHVDECIALAEKLSFGLADNEAFWSWIARHSPLAREKAWFKQETLEELRGELQDEGEDGEEGGEEETDKTNASNNDAGK